MPGEPARFRSVQRRVRRRRQRRAAGVLTVVAGATVATGALSFRSRPGTVAALAAATGTTSAPKAADVACPASGTGTGGGPGTPAPADGSTKVGTHEALVKGIGTVAAVDGDHVTITVADEGGTETRSVDSVDSGAS